MRHLLRTTSAKVVVLVVIAAFAAFVGAWAQRGAENKKEAMPVTGRMKTICVGRFLLDLPMEAQVEITRARVSGFDIATHDESDTAFLVRIDQRRAHIEHKPDRSGGRENLESVREVKNDAGIFGKTFIHSRTVTEGQSSDGLTVERYRYEGVAVEALVHGNGVSVDFSTEYQHGDSIGPLLMLVSQLVPNPANGIPPEPGFCIDRAYIRDPLTADQGEEVMMIAWLPGRPDVVLKLILAAGTAPDEQGLLQRSAGSRTRFASDPVQRVSTIRAKQRNIGGLVGDELVERFVEKDDVVVHSFWWEVNGTEHNVLAPHIVLTLDTGPSGRAVPSLSEHAAIDLWDKVAASLRLRPTRPDSSSVSSVRRR